MKKIQQSQYNKTLISFVKFYYRKLLIESYKQKWNITQFYCVFIEFKKYVI